MTQETEREQILKLVTEYADKYISTKAIPDLDNGRVLVSGKVIGNQEIANMVDACLDGWLTSGRYNNQFEETLAKYWGKKKCLTVNSGSSANLVAFSALTSPKLRNRALKPGDEVITVAAGFPTTINPIIQNGCIPVFVDIEAETHNINVDLIEAAISNKTKAIMIAHALGNPFDFNAVRSICDKYGLWLIEDCCDALGSRIDGIHVGTLADICTVSFYPAHHITMGEGGAVLTDNQLLAKICESFRDWGRDCHCGPGQDNSCGKRFKWKLGDLPEGYDHKYTYSHMGYNLKISDTQAACGLAQLSKLDQFISKRVENYNYLTAKLSSLQGIRLIQPITGATPSWFGCPVIIDNKSYSRDSIVVELNNRRIDTRLFFGGNITRQPYMKGRNFRVSGDLENTDYLMKNAFWLGVYPGLTESHLDYVFNTLSDILNS